MNILTAEFVLSASHPDQLPHDRRPEVAFAGRSNVGKSSLLNVLLRRKLLAKTSTTPGKTRLLNCYLVNQAFYFVDLPGYGFARVPQAERRTWRRMVESYLTGRPTLRGIVHLIDARHIPNRNDKELLAWLSRLGIPSVLAVTKSDKLPRGQLQQRIRQISEDLIPGGEVMLIPCSARTRTGLAEIWWWIEGVL